MRLIDCFMRLIVYVIYTVRQIRENQPDFETVKNNIDHLLEQTLKIKENKHFSDQD